MYWVIYPRRPRDFQSFGLGNMERWFNRSSDTNIVLPMKTVLFRFCSEPGNKLVLGKSSWCETAVRRCVSTRYFPLNFNYTSPPPPSPPTPTPTPSHHYHLTIHLIFILATIILNEQKRITTIPIAIC